MNDNYNNESKIIPISSINELLQDAFYFSLFLHLKKSLKDSEAKNYMVMFIKGISIVFIYELSLVFEEYDILEQKKFFCEGFDKKRIMEERQWVKQCIVDSESMQEKKAKMGLDFNELFYDMNVIVNNNELLDMNFEIYNENVDLEFWNNVFAVIESVANAIFKALTNNEILLQDVLSTADEIIGNFEEKNKNFFTINRYSYSVNKLFSKTSELTEKDKIFIMYRYRMVHSIFSIEKLFKDNMMEFTSGDLIKFNLNRYIKKIKALIITIIGNDLQKMNTLFSKELLQEINDKITNQDFFKINRALRNNIHYSNIRILNKNENEILDINQNIYLKIIENAMIENLYVDIDSECEQMTNFLRACSEQGLSEEEIKKDYEKKYLTFLYTGKLIK